MPLLSNLSYGEQLKRDLGLERFRSVVIRKIINLPLNIFLVYYNSRFPYSFLPIAKIRSLESVTVNRLVNNAGVYSEKPFTYTVPMKIENLGRKLPSNSIIIKIDITGEFFANKKLYKKK